MSKNDGGPAFPVECTYCDGELIGRQTASSSGFHVGLSLRDYFAAAIATGRESQTDERTYYSRAHYNPDFAALNVEEWRAAIVLDDARYCYRMADAMLKAREEDN